MTFERTYILTPRNGVISVRFDVGDVIFLLVFFKILVVIDGLRVFAEEVGRGGGGGGELL